MRKQLVTLIVALMLCAVFPATASADEAIVEPGAELASISVELTGTKLTIMHAEGSLLEIFSLTGSKLSTIKIDSDVKTIDLNLRKGCYILKVGNVVRKISVC